MTTTDTEVTQADRKVALNHHGFEEEADLSYWGSGSDREQVNETAKALARHRTLTPAQAAGPVLSDIPRDIVEQVGKMGRAEWGATPELTSEGHLAHLENSLRLTREHFDYADIPVKMHGLYLDGTETILCHTGTSPNSPINAQALTGAWNWLHDLCVAITQAEGPQA